MSIIFWWNKSFFVINNIFDDLTNQFSDIDNIFDNLTNKFSDIDNIFDNLSNQFLDIDKISLIKRFLIDQLSITFPW